MKSFVYKFLQFISFKIIGRQLTRKYLVKLFEIFDFDLLSTAHSELGINNYGNSIRTGEQFFLERILSEKFSDSELILFDVGANNGEYSLSLKKIFPSSKLFSFEPNPKSFELLEKNVGSEIGIYPFQYALGREKGSAKIFSYNQSPTSEHASLVKSVMTDLHDSDDIVEYKIDIIDIDSFCSEKNITQIDFLKIDTEGYELEVLMGAKFLLKNLKISVIQFEFNEMNVYSRVYLKDFYSLLPNYDFYRLKEDGLINLGLYNTNNEIFKFQNIVAFKK